MPRMSESNCRTLVANIELHLEPEVGYPLAYGPRPKATEQTACSTEPKGNDMHTEAMASEIERPVDVVYLDFDGVIHHEAVYISHKRGIYIDQTIAPGAVLFEWAPILVDALQPYPNVKLVLSTSWCRQPGFSRAKKRLPIELHNRVVGGTYHRDFHGSDPWWDHEFTQTTRASQILADVSRRKPRRWIAVDDDVDHWPVEYLDHLVPCDGVLGLSSLETQRCLREKLAAMHHLPGG
jgi:hypothetical protein